MTGSNESLLGTELKYSAPRTKCERLSVRKNFNLPFLLLFMANPLSDNTFFYLSRASIFFISNLKLIGLVV